MFFNSLDIFIEVNEHVMKPLEEYMLFTKTGIEKVNVSNQHGVRSAQCSSDFDVIHEKTPITINLNISQVRKFNDITMSTELIFRELIKHGCKMPHNE